MKPRYLTIMVLTILILSNCKKDNRSSTNILTSKTWKRALYDKNPSTNPRGPVLYNDVENCEKDDTFKFDNNGNLTLNRGSDKCESSELQNETQTYILDRTTKEFTINGEKFTLAEESSGQIKYYAALPSFNNQPRYIIFLLQ